MTFNLKKGSNTITCLTKPTNLTGGLYSIDCGILHPGMESIGHIDEVYDATTFIVSDYRTPNHDIRLTQREAIYYTDNTWKFNGKTI